MRGDMGGGSCYVGGGPRRPTRAAGIPQFRLRRRSQQTGRSTVNVEPTPGSLCNRTSPLSARQR